MIFLDNLKISNKILMAMLTLAVALGVSATYSSLQLHRIASTYSVLTEQKGPAAVEVARAARQVNQLGYAAYRVATYDAADPEAQASKAAFEDSVGKLRANLDNAARLAPDQAGRIAAPGPTNGGGGRAPRSTPGCRTRMLRPRRPWPRPIPGSPP
jgi:hypothetical protein